MLYKAYNTFNYQEGSMKYIFIAGAPGSKWSSVAKNIYYSSDVNSSDYSDDRTYYHSAWGEPQLMHLGVYWDPGMEFGKNFDRLDQYSREELEAEFDAPFSADSSGVKIIKSHVFCNHLDYIANTWPDCPILMVYRPDDACLGWWVKCGHFNITYPLYHDYYVDLQHMSRIIENQNADLLDFQKQNSCKSLYNSGEVCYELNLQTPEFVQNYLDDDIEVFMYYNK